MSAGAFDTVTYDAVDGNGYNISVQPETLSLTLNSVANEAGTATVANRAPSVNASGSRRRNGIHARVVRFSFDPATVPSGYKVNGVIQLPVFRQSVWDGYKKQQTGTYTLNGTSYNIRFVGKSAEVVV